MSARIFDLFLSSEHKAGRRGNRQRRAPSRTGLSSPVFGRFSALGSFFHSAVSVISPVTVIVSPAWYTFSPSLPADEGVTFALSSPASHLAVGRRFRPRFAVQQDVCDRERPGFPNSRERHLSPVTVILTFRLLRPDSFFPLLLVLPALEQMPFLCGRFEGDVRALAPFGCRFPPTPPFVSIVTVHIGITVYEATSDNGRLAAALSPTFAVFRGLIFRVVVIPAVDFYAAGAIFHAHVRGVGSLIEEASPSRQNICAVVIRRIVVNPI